MSPWQACDIRGPYPGEVSPTLLRSIGAHMAPLLPPEPRVLVAGDARLSTPALKEALADGLVNAGAKVQDAGQIPTPVASFAHQHLATDAALIVTASHNPASHNGLKLIVKGLPPAEEDWSRLRLSLETEARRGNSGTFETVNVLPAYVEWIDRRWQHLRELKRATVVLDAGNGAWSELGPAAFEKLGFSIHRLFCEIDGRYPNRSPDCARAANLGVLAQTVRETGAELGIAWDGDGDRVAFADRLGRIVSADQVSMILAGYLLHNRPNEKVVYDLKLSDALRRMVLAAGGIPLVERSGHAFLRRRMVGEGALFGCEVSGHYFYRELEGRDDGLFTAFLMAEIVAREGALDAIVAALPPIYITPDLRVSSNSAAYEVIVERLRSQFAPARETHVDGVRLEMPDGSVLVRRSVTEPATTLRIEGASAASLRRLAEACAEAIPEMPPHLLDCIDSSKQELCR